MAEVDVRTCSICIEQFKEPKLLPCFHTFCLHCLKHYVKRSANGGTFKCPVCRYEIALPKSGVSAFQTNFYIEAEADRHAYQPSLTCDVCSNLADRKCRDCSQLLCKSCTAIHSSLSVTESHITIVLGDVEDDIAVISRPQFCAKHKDEVIRFYCRPCEKPICRDCKLTSHEGHKTEDLSDLVVAAKSSLAKTKSDMEQCIETMTNNLRIIDSWKESVENKVKETSTEINKSADSVISLINEYRTKELEKIYTVGQVEKKGIEETGYEIASNKRCLQAQTDHVDMILSTGLDADVMVTSNEAKKVLEDVINKKQTSLSRTVTRENSFIQKRLTSQWMLDVFANAPTSLVPIICTPDITHLKQMEIFTILSESVDVIGPVSDVNGAWVSFSVKGCRNSTILLVDVTGKILKKIIMQKDKYAVYRKLGYSFVSSLLSENQESNSYNFCGKQTPLYDKKKNGDLCQVNMYNHSVNVRLSDGSEVCITLDAFQENKFGFSPRDVCWGTKDDLFIVDSGLNVIHRYILSEGFKECFVSDQSSFLPTAVAMDAKELLWIGERNGRISICNVYK